MESFEIMSAAADSGIPAVAIRAISDSVDEDMPIDMTDIFTDEGQISMPRILAQAAKNPQSIAGLMRLGHNSKVAAETIAGFLDQLRFNGGGAHERSGAEGRCGGAAGFRGVKQSHISSCRSFV